MKQTRKIFVALLVLMTILMSLAVVAIPASAAGETWVETDIDDIKSTDVVIVTWTKGTTMYALSNDKGSSAAPSAVVVTENSTAADNIKWNISSEQKGYVFYPNGTTSKWLYCTSSNNGVRVGTNDNKYFTIDSASGYLKHIATSRYLGVYTTNPDVRCYTNTTGNTASQTLKFFVLSKGACDHLNKAPIGEAKDATCTQTGLTAGSKCLDCGFTIETQNEIPALSHNYVNGVCDMCGAEKPASLAGRYYIAAIRSSGNYFYMTNNLGTASTKRYQASNSGVTTLPISVSNPSTNMVFVLEENADGTYKIFAEGITGTDKYLGWTSGNSGALVAASSAKSFTVEETEGGLFNIYFKNGSENRTLSFNNTSGNDYFAFYAGTQINDLALIPIVEETAHDHKYTSQITTPATCTEAGVKTFTCECGEGTYTEAIEALGHDFVEGICSRCKAEDPNYVPACQHKDTGLDAKCDLCGEWFLPTSPFKLEMYQASKKQTYYFTGAMSGYYFATSTDITKAVDLYAEEVDGGYNVYFMSGSTKNYLYIQLSGTHINAKFGSTKAVWYVDPTYGCLTTEVNGAKYFLGTYSTYVTFGGTAYSRLNASTADVSQYIGRAVSLENHVCEKSSSTVTAPKCEAEGYTTYKCNLCGQSTKADYVDALGHDLVDVEGKNPTCYEEGYTAHKDCSRCEYVEGKKTLPVLKAVATANGVKCATLAEALEKGSEIVLLEDIALDAPIVFNGSYTLDLSGYTLSYESTVMGEAMITNKGSLVINDSVGTGVINYNYVGANDASYGKGNYTISNAGTLTVNGGKITIANLRQHAKYPIDNNSTTGDAILVINGGHLYNYNTSAIRMFCNSTTNKNSVTINGGLIEGYSAIWMQNPGKNTVHGALEVTGGEIRTTAAAYVNGTASLKEVGSKIYCTSEGGAWAEGSLVSLTGGTFNENVYLASAAPADIVISGGTFNGEITSTISEGFISGGTFSSDVTEYAAHGFVAIKGVDANGNVTYSVIESVAAVPSIQEVDGVKYWFIGTVNTGVKAEGIDGKPGQPGADGDTPFIGENGNWWIGKTDTGVKAEGIQGKPGADGNTPYIGENGNWWIGETDTGVKAEGIQGKPGQDGISIENVTLDQENSTEEKSIYIITLSNGETYTFEVLHGADGEDGKPGQDGADGEDGKDGADADATKEVRTAIAIATVAIIFALAVLLFWRVKRRSWWCYR